MEALVAKSSETTVSFHVTYFILQQLVTSRHVLDLGLAPHVSTCLDLIHSQSEQSIALELTQCH